MQLKSRDIYTIQIEIFKDQNVLWKETLQYSLILYWYIIIERLYNIGWLSS